jgi:hypothetical protein
MKSTAVVTESKTDAVLLQLLLGIAESEPGVRYVAAGSLSSADSRARTILMKGQENVAFVVDSGAINPPRIREFEQLLDALLAPVSMHPGLKIFLIKPEIDALLFEDRHIVEELTGAKIDDVTFVRGQYEPRRILDELLHGKSRLDAYKEKLPQMDLSPLRNLPVIKELKQFLEDAPQAAAA